MQIYDICVICKCNDKVRDGGTDITDHDPADHQDAHTFYLDGDQKDEGHGRHGADKGGQYHFREADGSSGRKTEDHDQRHRQLGA